MNKIEKIRAEIDRRYNYEKEMYCDTKPDGRPNDGWAESLAIMGVLEDLLSFVDTLSEEPVCLYDGEAPSKQKCGDCTIACSVRVEEESDKDLKEAADKFIRMVVDTAGHPGWDWTTQDIADAFIAGAKWQEEQMMKEAVEGIACPDDCEIWVNLVGYGYKFNDGDKVKLIVIKEE